MTEHERSVEKTEAATVDAALETTAAEPSQPSSTPWSRRHFLRRAATGGATIALAACGRGGRTESPIITPTPSPISPSPLSGAGGRVYMPLVRNQPGAGDAMLSPLDEPTLTPTPPKATATPEPPTPTPTPQATPFPPGPPSKLGLFVAWNHPQIFEVLSSQGATVVKTLELDRNFALQIKQTAPQVTLIGRIDLPQVQLADLDPMAAARQLCGHTLADCG